MVERPLGGRDISRRYHWLQRQDVVRQSGNFSQRQITCHGPVPRHRSGPSELRSDDRGSEGVFAALEDEHAALPPQGKERTGSRISMRGICRRINLWTSEEATE